MKAISARATKGLNLGAMLIATDNSGAKIVKLVSVKRGKGKKGRQVGAKVSDWVKVSVRKGIPDRKGFRRSGSQAKKALSKIQRRKNRI